MAASSLRSLTRIVHALGLVRDSEGVEDDIGACKLCAEVAEGELLGGLFCLLVCVGVEYVHNVDRADVADGVVKVHSEGFAKSEVLPLLGVTEHALCVAHICDLDRHIDEVTLSVATHKVDRSGTDISGYHVSLCSVGDSAVSYLAVCPMFVCHGLCLLL